MPLTHFASSFCTLPTLASPTRASVGPVSSKNYRSLPPKVRCMVATEDSDQIVRRSANYQSSTWEYDFVQSLSSKYKGEPYTARNRKLKAEIRMRLANATKPLDQLELIDTLQRLGLSYHFVDEIESILKSLFNENHIQNTKTANDLAWLHDDVKGMLYLYEASHLLVEGESILDDARNFTTKNLEKYVKNSNSSKYLSKLSTRLGEKLDFVRDRPMENFLWTVGVLFEPQFSNCRRMLAKFASLITAIDDVYDVYGTLDELELFTDAIWADLCKSYLLEAKWYYSGYTPSLQEYLDNAWVSISAPVSLVHAYFYVSSPTAEEASHFMEEYPDIIRWSSMILRLADDLGTSSNYRSLPPKVRCMVATEASDQIVRRSANYQSSTWEYDFIQSLTSKYKGEPYTARNRKLKAEIRMRLANASKPLDQLELIDTLQRLGLSYHFVDEIESILKSLFDENHIQNTKTANDLYATALEFRLLRQHGYKVPQEVFNQFKDEQGSFRAWLHDDLKGMLYLYEASHLLVEGESILDDARDFATKNLEKYVKKSSSSEYLSKLVSHALELPLAWRTPRLQANWFINVYETKTDMEPILLELAKLDFNMVQAIHQEDLKHSARWWKSTRLGERLDFARDRPMENFFWTVGVIFEPQFSNCRRMLAKVNSLITTIDDVYDVYGTLDELELFTDAIVRWDLNFMDQLPHYMKLCFLSLYNSVNEMAYDILKDQGVDILPYLKKVWADLCKSYLLEAKWYYSGYTPSLQEYLDNAWVSISAPVSLVHAYFYVSRPTAEEASHFMEEYPDIIRWSSMILRLADDLGTSSDELKRGDVSKSIQCYMHETEVSEEKARDHIKNLIGNTWKKINDYRFANPRTSQTFIGVAMNLARMAQCMYQYGDGHVGPVSSKNYRSLPPKFRCMVATEASDQIVRRSANYQSSTWEYDFVQSLSSKYKGEPYTARTRKLKEEIRTRLANASIPLDQLELIDTLQRLGLSYHFVDEIESILKSLFDENHIQNTKTANDLYGTALEFRLLRQHGYKVPQEVFNQFKDEQGNFRAWLHDDLKGMLYLYEASHLLVEGESILDDARDFTAKNLEKYVKKCNSSEYLSKLVSHALELPLAWRMLRLEANWFINVYETKTDMEPILLELAKLDFNMVQAIHQEDLKHSARWWKSTGLGEKLDFARDRPMENFLWTVGFIFEPQFSNCRRMLAKVNSLLTTIDDVYDVYGTLDELQLFTDAIVRWDLNYMDQLPHYMKLCFLSLYNSVNEMAYDILKDQGVDILPYLKKAAKWYYSGYTPSLQEYLDNAWVSISAPVFLVHAYFYVSSPTTEEALHFMEEYPDIIRWSSMILRLADDLGTSSDELKRGDVSKSIQCYMYETEVFEEKARDHIKNLIGNTWKKINDYRFANTRTSQTFIGVAMNLARMAQCMYQYGDGHGVGDLETKDRGEPYTARNRKLKAEIRMRLANASKPLDQLELIDTLQRLGLSYHFVDEIESILKSLFDENHIQNTKTANDLGFQSIQGRTRKV
uniref:Isoprene synthase, chloroplastic n=1 Tax=Salix viminalis TaxID=40686 RepID=A0A6N2L7C7_SALVM